MTTVSGDDVPTVNLTVARRQLVLFIVVLSSAAYNAATFTATAILPQMQGAMAATQDEISWTVTFNILATAVVTPMTGWLISAFGRRTVMVGSLAGFTAASLLCGLAHSLDDLILWRVLQGAFGAPLLPLGQALILDAFPRRQHAMAISVFGMANTAGPIIGPMLAGVLSDYYGWRWGFYMIVPVALLATIGARLILPPDEESQPTSLDWTGFLSLSVAIAAMQIILSRGQRLDWFESTEITVATFVGIVAFYVFLVHSLTAKNPFLDLRLLLDRNFALGLLLVGLFGMVNFTPMVLLPPLLQSHLGYTDRLIGIMIGWRGVGVAMGFFLAMMTGRFDPRITMIVGFGVQIFSGVWLMAINLDVEFTTLALNAFLQGTAVGLIWAPIATTAFWTITSRSRPEAAAMFHLVRNIASSFFISICVAIVVRATGANYSRLVENVSPYSKQLMLTPVFGGWNTESVTGLAALSKEINRQAAMIAYTNAFFIYTLISLSAIPLALLVRRVNLKEPLD
jgi:DHA2 family multidrug resistance protein